MTVSICFERSLKWIRHDFQLAEMFGYIPVQGQEGAQTSEQKHVLAEFGRRGGDISAGEPVGRGLPRWLDLPLKQEGEGIGRVIAMPLYNWVCVSS